MKTISLEESDSSLHAFVWIATFASILTQKYSTHLARGLHGSPQPRIEFSLAAEELCFIGINQSNVRVVSRDLEQPGDADIRDNRGGAKPIPR